MAVSGRSACDWLSNGANQVQAWRRPGKLRWAETDPKPTIACNGRGWLATAAVLRWHEHLLMMYNKIEAQYFSSYKVVVGVVATMRLDVQHDHGRDSPWFGDQRCTSKPRGLQR